MRIDYRGSKVHVRVSCKTCGQKDIPVSEVSIPVITVNGDGDMSIDTSGFVCKCCEKEDAEPVHIVDLRV